MSIWMIITGVPNCVCPAISAPVCGIDDVTYDNKCHAKCNNVVEFKCEKECSECSKGEHNAIASEISIMLAPSLQDAPNAVLAKMEI